MSRTPKLNFKLFDQIFNYDKIIVSLIYLFLANLVKLVQLNPLEHALTMNDTVWLT